MLKFIAIDKALRKKVVECVTPFRDVPFSAQNIDLKYGVYDSKNGFFLTQSYYLGEFVKRCGDDFVDTEYAVVMKSGLLNKDRSFIVSCAEYYNGDILITQHNEESGLSEEDIISAIRFYHSSLDEVQNTGSNEKASVNGKRSVAE